MPAEAEAQSGAEPLERPATAQPQPGDSQQDDRHERRGGQREGAVDCADQHHDGGHLGADHLSRANTEQSSMSDALRAYLRQPTAPAAELREVAAACQVCRHRLRPPS
jgi:hypothetical protein